MVAKIESMAVRYAKGVSLLKSLHSQVKEKEELKPEYKVEMVNPIPQDDLVFMLSQIKKGHRELKNLGELEFLGGGMYGAVFAYKNYAIKISRSSNSEDFKDGEILKNLQHVKSIVKLYAIVEHVAIITERVVGMTVEKYLYRGDKEKFISPLYTEVYEDGLKEIAFSGYMVNDLHNENVLISKETGLPLIVDVGMFRKTNSKHVSKNSIDLHSNSGSRNALFYSNQMKKWVDDKKAELGYSEQIYINFNQNRIECGAYELGY